MTALFLCIPPVIIWILTPKNVYLGARIILVSGPEAEIWQISGFGMAAILKSKYLKLPKGDKVSPGIF